MLYSCPTNIRSYAATAENPTAARGAGGQANNGRKGSAAIGPFKANAVQTLLDVSGTGIVRHIWCTIPPGNVQAMRNLIVRMYWDGQTHASVEAPLGDFFGVAHGRQRNMMSDYVSMQDERGFNCWIPMPFRTHARITIENDSGMDIDLLFYQVDFTLGDKLDEDAGYFHAQFRRSNLCPLYEDYTIVDGINGSGVYLGTVIGVRSILQEKTWFGEGEVKFFIDDDDRYPTICGTGLEDYMGSAWGLREVNTPQQGAPMVDYPNALFSIYRFHGKDPIYFRDSLKVTVQQIGYGPRESAKLGYGEDAVCYPAAGAPAENCLFERSDDYCSVAYWYQTLPSAPFPTLPDREARSADLMVDKEDGPKRADQ
ncbi:glycoside hydrolase family 172 protein [Cohnella sp. GbtcB17]|uniref:glycoside hydrolase family 172 protein n=1 Tax=Cohnella sp. GbtcB17 TaxID=2824762 RepID=UPI001C2FA0C8|nr:glycoside hydrolase family 172 protein [Cohnella sp. GbtcB17]